MSAAAVFASRTAAALETWPAIGLWPQATPAGFRSAGIALGGGPRLLIKRDDAIGFGFGGNKVRKLDVVAAAALRAGAETLITAGGLQSNHARATAFTAARLGMRAILVLNGKAPEDVTGNLRLSTFVGAEIRYVGTRDDRQLEMERIAAELSDRRPPAVRHSAGGVDAGRRARHRARGRRVVSPAAPPDAIFRAALSSGGTQAGLVAGCASPRRDACHRHQRRRVVGGPRRQRSGASWAVSPRSSGRNRRERAVGRIEVDDDSRRRRLWRSHAGLARSGSN